MPSLLLYSDRVWRGCEALDRPDLLAEDKCETDAGRMEDVVELTAAFEDSLAEQTVEAALETLNDAGIPATEYNSVGEAAAMDQVEHLASSPT